VRLRWKVVGMLPAVAAVLAITPAARATVVPSQSVTLAGQVVRWTGAYPDPTGQGYNPPTDATCQVTTAGQDVCDIMTINVDTDLPADVKGPKNPAPPNFTKAQAYPVMPGDGLLVSIKWATDFDQWNLYVDGNSSPYSQTTNAECQTPVSVTSPSAGCGVDLDSNSQSVLITPAATDIVKNHWKATYTVKIGAFYTDFDTSGIDRHYSGEASLFLDPSQRKSGTQPMLPAIHTEAPANFHVSDIPPVVSNPTGWRYTPSGTFTGPFQNSCYLDETVDFGSTRCLRFDNDVRNYGEGPLTLEFNYTPGALATALAGKVDVPTSSCQMQQELLKPDATATFVPAGPCVFHTQHMHFHYQNFGRYQMFAVPADGNPRAIPVPGGRPSTPPVTVARKVGFCTIDVDNYTFGLPAGMQRPRTFSFPTCNVPNGYVQPGAAAGTPSAQYAAGVPEWMGISPGWGDIYTWDLPAQYLDISHVADGRYEVVSTSNPDGGITASSRAQETGITCIDLKSNSDGSATVKVVKEFPSQANDAPLPSCQVQAASTTSSNAGPTVARSGSGLPDTAAALPSLDFGRSALPWWALVIVVGVVAAVGGLGYRRR
jgi:hypothetical protein